MNTIEMPVSAAFATAEDGVSAAMALAERGQSEAALDLFGDLRAAFPDAPDGYLRAADLLTRLGRTEQSLALLQDGRARFAGDVRFDVSLGWLTLHKRDLPAAEASWERVRNSFGKHPVGYVGGAVTLREMKRLDEANALLETALGLFPTDPGVRIEHAWVAHRRQDWQEALRRWDGVRRSFPDHVAGFTGAAATLSELGRLAEAEASLFDVIQRHPGDRGAAIEFARVAQRRRDWDAAVSRWQDVRAKFADWPVGFTGGAESLRQAGRWQEADALLAIAAQRWPDDLGPATERAWLAYHRRDWEAAVERWARVRQRFPDNQSGYLIGARSLQAAGQGPEAALLLADAQRRWPDDLTVLTTAADLANARTDHPECIRLGKAMVALFPDEGAGYFHAGRALRELGRHAEAEALLADVPDRFPDDAAILSIWASLRMGLQDWQEAIQRWRLLQRRFPTEPKFFWQCANALHATGSEAEAEALLRDATQRFPGDMLIASMYAECLLRRGAATEADAAAARIRQDYPANPSGYGLGVRARRAMGDLVGVAALLQSMLAHLPEDQMALRLWAEDAGERREWAAAEERWSRFRERFPDDPAGYVGGAQALREAGSTEASDALLARGIASLPHNGRILTEFAHNAVRRKDWGEAVARWGTFRRQLPETPAGYLGGAQALRDAGRLDEAEGLLRSAIDLFPAAVTLAAEYVNIARTRHDYPAMVERARLVTERFPDRLEGVVGYAEALSVAGRHEDAEAILLDAQSRFGSSLEPFAEYAQVAIRRGAWAVSLARWQDAQRRFPHVEAMAHRIFEARMRVAEVEPDAGGDDVATQPGPEGLAPERSKPDRAKPDLAGIVEDFESLGGAGHGCEFGLFQRAHGAEPLGLLRWADLGADLLTEALEARFDGVGLPEHTLVFTPSSAPRAEYWTRDKRYWMAMRCFIYADEVPYDKMVTQACRRLQYLRRKLVEDLEAGEKIFVFKSLARNLTDGELARLHRATRGYGDNTLLYVRYDDAENPNGTVRVAGPGLMIGYVDRFAFSREDKDLGPAVDRWAAVCTRAHAIWKTGGASGTPAGGVAVAAAAPAVALPALAEAARSTALEPAPARPEPVEPALVQPDLAPKEPSLGERLIAGPCVDHPPVALRWSEAKLAELQRTTAEKPANTREHAYALILRETLAGERASARARIGKLADDFAFLYPGDPYTFEVLVLSSILSGQWDITPRLLRDKFDVDWCSAVDADDATPAHAVRWDIDRAGKSRFHFSSALFSDDRGWIGLLFWLRSLTLFHAYTVTPGSERGSVMSAIGDAPTTPGLAGSGRGRGDYLVPDSQFLDTNAYASLRASFDAARVRWDDCEPVAFWRGASTGQLRSDWRNLQRIKLCLIAKQPEAAGLIDAGITSLVNLPAAMLREAEAAGLRASFVKPVDFLRYKYQIDVDGNVNAWQGLFQKLLSGNTVLKVRSPAGYRQWFYDDLVPWENHVPVDAEMGDLIEKVRWLRAHDDKARRIGQAGLALARSLTRSGELERVRPTIGAAIRYFSGRPEVVVRFDADTAESRFLVDGWSGITTASGVSGRYAVGPESRIRFPRPASQGDLRLNLTLGAGGPGPVDPFRMVTIVNGTQVDDTVVAYPRAFASVVPAAVVARDTQTRITLLFPEPGQPAPPTGLLFTELQLGAR